MPKVELDNTIFRSHVRIAVDVSCAEMKKIIQREELTTAGDVKRFFQRGMFAYLILPLGTDREDSDEEEEEVKTAPTSGSSSSVASAVASESKKREREETSELRPGQKKLKAEEHTAQAWLATMEEKKEPFVVVLAHGSEAHVDDGLETYFEHGLAELEQAMHYLGATTFRVVGRQSMDCCEELSDSSDSE